MSSSEVREKRKLEVLLLEQQNKQKVKRGEGGESLKSLLAAHQAPANGEKLRKDTRHRVKDMSSLSSKEKKLEDFLKKGKPELITKKPDVKTQENNDLPGVIRALADFPEKTLLNEKAMAEAFHVVERTIRRMVIRKELPPPIKMSGHSVWMLGHVLKHIEDRIEQATKQKEV